MAYMLFTTAFWLGLVFHLNDIVVLFRMPKSKEVLSSTSDSGSDREVDTKV